MKILLSSRVLFLLCIVIIVVTNIVVLSGVASNRTGKPGSQITLTERELQLLSQVHKENSGLTLRLAWRTLGKDDGYPNWRSPVWFNTDKLKELGFNIDDYLKSKDNNKFYKKIIPKVVFIVLENNGDPYREAVKRAEMALEKKESLFRSNSGDKILRANYESAEKRLKHERITKTRLFAVDAGINFGILREKYDDRARFIITKGLVRPRYYYENKNKEVLGYISKLIVENIHVPLRYRKEFDAILIGNKSEAKEFGPLRFEVELAYGRRFEPWIMSVKHIDDKSD